MVDKEEGSTSKTQQNFFVLIFFIAFLGQLKIEVMARIFSLANELLASIFKHLNGIELAIVAQTCQRFHDASLIDQIWQHLCFRGKFYNTVMSSTNLESVKEYISRSRSKRHAKNQTVTVLVF